MPHVKYNKILLHQTYIILNMWHVAYPKCFTSIIAKVLLHQTYIILNMWHVAYPKCFTSIIAKILLHQT
jgi:hypothetical protein